MKSSKKKQKMGKTNICSVGWFNTDWNYGVILGFLMFLNVVVKVSHCQGECWVQVQQSESIGKKDVEMQQNILNTDRELTGQKKIQPDGVGSLVSGKFSK